MADTPTSLAAELRRLADARAEADAELTRTLSSAYDLHGERIAGIAADMERVTARIEALPVPGPSWTPRFPGDTPPGTIRWGQGGGNDSARAREHEAAAGVPMGAWRLFYTMSQAGSAVAKCREALAAGRVPVLSMKPGDTWANVAAGKIDVALRSLFVALDALGGPVLFILHHEPEGGGGTNAPDDPGGPSVWRAMQARVRTILDGIGSTNIAFGPCLMVWTWSPSSGRRPDDWWTPEARWDFYAGDLYQSKEAAPAPTTQTSWLNFVAWCEAKGLPVVIGELGNRGSDATAGAELRETYEFLTQIDCVASTYFDTPLNSGPEPYTLVGEPLKAFRELMKDPRSVHLDRVAV